MCSGAQTVERLFKEQGLEGIITERIHTNTRPDITADLDEVFVWAAIETAEALIKGGAQVVGVTTLEEAQKYGTILRQELKDDKVHFFYEFVTVVGRKPL